MEMRDMIQSKDMLEYLEKNNYEFTEIDKATICYNSKLALPEKHRLLIQLSEKTKDQELSKMISKRVNYDAKCFDTFMSNQGNYIYTLEVYEDEEWLNEGYFTDAQIAKAYGMVMKNPFLINKCRITTEVHKKIYSESTVAAYTYDCTGNITKYWSSELSDQVNSSDDDFFVKRFVNIPNPFQRGDIVRHIGKDEYGVVETSQSEWAEFLNMIHSKRLFADWYDASITVSFLSEDGKFSHQHINPIFLEKAEPEDSDPQKNLFEMASGLLRGEAGFDFFLASYDDYKEKVAKNQ